MNDCGVKLFEAVRYNDVESVKKLLPNVVNINSLHPHGFLRWAPLHLAAKNGHEEIVYALLEQDEIDVNVKDNFEWTPLHLAASNSHKEIVDALLKEESIDVNAKNIMKQTPLDLANNLGDQDIADALKAKGAGIDITDENENISLLMTDKETQSDKLNLLDKDESDIQPLSDFEQATQSDQLL